MTLNVIAVVFFHQSQLMLIGASSERSAEDEQHPSLYRSETAYLTDLRRQADRDNRVFNALMMGSGCLMVTSLAIGLASLNVKVSVPDPELASRPDS